MPITNLAIQRKRLRDLKKLFENNKRAWNVRPYHFDRHEHFVISFDRLLYSDLELLRKEGWEIQEIYPLTSSSCTIVVYRYNLEKQSNYIRKVSEKYQIKNRSELNIKLKDLHIQNLQQQNNDLELEKKKLQKQVENLQYIHAITGGGDNLV